MQSHKLSRLSPVTFTWKSGPHQGRADIGFIAQDVEKVVPEVVHTDDRQP
jgi:Chaperone of endosialidase